MQPLGKDFKTKNKIQRESNNCGKGKHWNNVKCIWCNYILVIKSTHSALVSAHYTVSVSRVHWTI